MYVRKSHTARRRPLIFIFLPRRFRFVDKFVNNALPYTIQNQPVRTRPVSAGRVVTDNNRSPATVTRDLFFRDLFIFEKNYASIKIGRRVVGWR